MTATPIARPTDPITSHAAAASARRTSAECRQNVHAVLAAHPDGLTHDELIEAYRGREATHGYRHHSDSGIRTRCHELVAEGRVEDTGEKRRLPSGRGAIVWAAKREQRGPVDALVPSRRDVFDYGHTVKVDAAFRGAHAGEDIGRLFQHRGKFAWRASNGVQGTARSRRRALRALVSHVYGQAVKW